MSDYALYKGEELLSIGSIYEIAEEMNISTETVKFYGRPVYQRRLKERKNSKSVRILIKIEDDE